MMLLLLLVASVMAHAVSGSPLPPHKKYDYYGNQRTHGSLSGFEQIVSTSELATGRRDPFHVLHEHWMRKHQVEYKHDTEKHERLNIFKENAAHIISHNSGNHTYKLGLNRFADMTDAEYKRYVNKYVPYPGNSASTQNIFGPSLRHGQGGHHQLGGGIPTSIDWRERGAVGPVKDQGQCGCCWAFSSVAAVEGLNALTTGKLLSLSEQVLIDCDVESVNNGCGGGNMGVAFEYMIRNGGVPESSVYPDGQAQGACQSDSEKSIAAAVRGYVPVPVGDEQALMEAVSRQPVSVAVDSSCPNFGMYTGGIFTEHCGNNLGHAVSIVGYGTDEQSGTPYWLVKNSWGPQWGENGYMKIARNGNGDGLCGINLAAVYPTA